MVGDAEMRSFRLAVLAELARAVPGGMGRTALMKCVYFLQELRGLPLGYRFSLYTYGPYDAEVLEDLKLAQAKGVISSKVVTYANGYGYAIEPGPEAARAQATAAALMAKHREALDWVANTFARRLAGELETASTLHLVDHELSRDGRQPDLAEVVARVHDIKPHLQREAIEREARRLKDIGLLRAAS